MLSGDAARAALAAYAASESDQRKGIRVRDPMAPALAGEIAQTAADHSTPATATAAKLDALTLAEREEVLGAIAPELGTDLAFWWEWSAAESYQTGWQRRAYRSADPAHSRHRRWRQLAELLRHNVRYPQPLSWHADWALHAGEWTPLGSLFASAIARGDTTIADTLIASLTGTHPTSGPSAHAYVGLLSAPDPRGWDVVERLLVTAERSEGLRQTILEAADVAHPDAFARILDVVVERSYARFAGTVRAVGVWIGEELGVRQEKQVTAALTRIRDELRQPRTRAEPTEGDAVDAFLAVWAMAVRDVGPAIAAAEALVASGDERFRLAGARLLADFQVPETVTGLARAVDDPSLVVYAAATTAWRTDLYSSEDAAVPMTDRVRAALHRRVETLGKDADVETGLIGHCNARLGSAFAADLLVAHAGDRPLAQATVEAASANGRWIAAHRYASQGATNRGPLFSLLADRSTNVRDAVRGALLDLPSITLDEAMLVEHALRLQAADLRTTALALLQKQEPSALQDSIARLAGGTAAQRRASAELGGAVNDPAGQGDPLPAVLRHAPGDRTPTTRPPAPDPSTWEAYHDRCRLVWTSLIAWLGEHADVEVQTHYGVELLANVRWLQRPADQEVPLPEVLGPWWQRIRPQLTDRGVEVALLARVPRTNRPWVVELARQVVGPVASELPKTDDNALAWQVLAAIADGAHRASWAEPTIRLIETVAASLPMDELSGPDEVMKRRGRSAERDRWGNAIHDDARTLFSDLLCNPPLDPAALTDEQVTRLWRAYRFIDEPEGAIDPWNGAKVDVQARDHLGRANGTFLVPDQPDRWPPPARVLAEAFHRGAATRADVVDAMVPASSVVPGHFGGGQELIRASTALRPPEWAADERLQQVVADVRTAVIEAETTRGDLPSPLSETAHHLRTTYGAEQLVRCLGALGKRPFVRGYLWTRSRESSLSHLVRVNQPLPDDTAHRLGRLTEDARITDARLIETAVYAPQWAALIEERLDWPGLESAVWWVHAHTKDQDWSVDAEIRAQWASEVSQRTPLDATDLVNGTVDVAWFHDVIATLGEERFQALLKAAKYASSAGGHKRAELFATALLGHVGEREIRQRIADKRHQDAVRALGLLPLDGPDTLLARYELLRAFVGSDRTSGSQRRASETTAVAVGLENLARTSGFRDPQRLIWAMEAEAIRDLAHGPRTAIDGDLVVSLAIDASGAPELTIQRAGRPLKSVPAASAKLPHIADLRDRAATLRKQAGRMRLSLETACALGDTFEPDEIDGLLEHPILAPMLRDLVLVDAEGRLGFPQDGTTLTAPDGTCRATAGTLRLAHPADLLAAGEWPDFQHALMRGQRRQPFKQLFRELYTLNANERDEAGVSSRRYAGHQVEGRRARGIFTSRGWVADFEQGFSRTFHEQKITVWCHLLDGWGSPTEVEDATIADVRFHPAGTWKPLPLADVPIRVFSEAMRDLDLVVSVAHASGVDPVVSESSIEMRRRLVDETAALLAMTNVEVVGHHARVKGALGTYSIHLGSGVVHRVPGHAVCIVPVSAQHRGRIFLPFADDDPRTAEIVAKVVLLARDDQIKDPTILQQLVG